MWHMRMDTNSIGRCHLLDNGKLLPDIKADGVLVPLILEKSDYVVLQGDGQRQEAGTDAPSRPIVKSMVGGLLSFRVSEERISFFCLLLLSLYQG